MNLASHAHQDIWTAIFTAAASFPAFPATATNSQCGSRYTPLNDILLIAKPILAQNRLLVTYTTSLASRRFTVHQHIHLVGTNEQTTSELHFMLERGNAHEIASRLTYARRYLLAITFSLALGIDDDGNGGDQGMVGSAQPGNANVALPPEPHEPFVAPGSASANAPSQSIEGETQLPASQSAIDPKMQEGMLVYNLWARLKRLIGNPAAQQVLIQCAGTPSIKAITPSQFPLVITALEQRLCQPTGGDQVSCSQVASAS